MLDIIGVGDTNVDVMIRVPHIASHDEKVRGQLLGNFPSCLRCEGRCRL